MNNRWITFDCFGTLVDWHTGFADMLQAVAGDRTAELIRAYHECERLLEQERPHRLYRDVLKMGIARAAAEIGLPLTDRQAASLPERWGTQRVFADVEPALAALRAAGWKLAVLTNCDVALFAETHDGFRQPFDLIVTAEQVKDYKPSLAHFRYFWRVSGVERHDWVHVACSWYHDIQPAREMSIRRIWVDRGKTGDDPTAATLRLEDARALPESVQRLSSMSP
ncbi:MAG: HAD hydrolase-like protein [Luteitalea sp.]|nr:HAD hydrolase-like protein [Luteitalea sp.]